MIRIEAQPWRVMLAEAVRAYPEECCGVLLGRDENGRKRVLRALPLENAWPGSRHNRYELRPFDLLRAEETARGLRLAVLGVYHSHPDCDAYFSAADLENSCPWFSFVVLSVREGRFSHAASWLPDWDQTRAEPEDLLYAS